MLTHTDAAVALVALASAAVGIALLTALSVRHHCHLRKLPIRIHVAGTRGKSSLTRLIAAALRANGLKVLAKTTGTVPQLIDANGVVRPWPRRGPPSIREQERFIALAAAAGAQAVVMECMAIKPDLVWASEKYIIRSNFTVITNARPDHLEELGTGDCAVAEALACAMPTGGHLYTTEEGASEPMLDRARLMNTRLHVIESRKSDPAAEHVSIVNALCHDLGLTGTAVARGMPLLCKERSAFAVWPLRVGDKNIRFANAFACNDVESLSILWGHVQLEETSTPVVLVNTRRDRPLRTRELLRFLHRHHPSMTLFLNGGRLSYQLARRAGFGPDQIRPVQSYRPSEVLSQLAAVAPDNGLIWGIGNYQGLGAKIIDEVERRCRRC